jgi:hypothetical protein
MNTGKITEITDFIDGCLAAGVLPENLISIFKWYANHESVYLEYWKLRKGEMELNKASRDWLDHE